MPAPATATEFVEFVRRSGVVDDPQRLARLGSFAGRTPAALAEACIRDGLLTNFQAEQILIGNTRRLFIGKYKILERLGRGGMGQVYLCEHRLMRRRVAVKVLPTSHVRCPTALERFHREARAAAAVDHPNIVRAFDIDQDGDLHFLVLEYVDGVNLQQLVRKAGQLPVERACAYVAEVCAGLAHSHAIDLIHRDIKPANILVDRSGRVKILDLGLAKFFQEGDDVLTRPGDDNVLGTANYLAPEQAVDSTAVDIRADIYALGGTLYYLLSGRPPFPESRLAQKFLRLQHVEPTPVREVRPDVPHRLAAVISKMMAKDVAARYQTPAEVEAALKPWTGSAIAPPSDAELPTLCPAASGTGRRSSGVTVAATTRPAATTTPLTGATPFISAAPTPLRGGVFQSRAVVPPPITRDRPRHPARPRFMQRAGVAAGKLMALLRSVAAAAVSGFYSNRARPDQRRGQFDLRPPRLGG